jgi:hypothetical protein
MKRKAVVVLAFTCVLTPTDLALAQEAAGSGGTPAVPVEPEGGSPSDVRSADERLQRSYRRWRRTLRRYGVWHGRDLLAAAQSAERPPGAGQLRTSIRRMKLRFQRFLQTAEGRAVRFLFKVRRIPAWGRGRLRSIAACESGGNPRAVGGGGVYRGMYQFSFSTWRAVGGSGDPAAAPRSEQTWRAWLLLSRHGAGHWPVCG